MSSTQNYPIRCPRCGEEQVVALYEAINARDNPELREALLHNRLNGVTCTACRHAFRIDKSLIYIDPGNGFLVHLLPAEDGSAAEAERQFTGSAEALAKLCPEGFPMPSLHLVLSRVELVERVFLLEAGLDERVVEYVKYLIYSRNAGRLDPRAKNLLFNAEDSNDEGLAFVVQDRESGALESMLHYQREAYDALCEMFDEDAKTPSLLELFPGPHVSARRLLCG